MLDKNIDENDIRYFDITKEDILSLAEENEDYDYVEVYDTHIIYCHEDESMRETTVRFPEHVKYEELVKFNGLKVNKAKFFRLMKKYIPNEQLLVANKIIFITSEEDEEALYEEYDDITIMENCIGMVSYFHNVVIINERHMRECLDYVDTDDKEIEYNVHLWTTLIHEVRHTLCDCVLLQDLLPEDAHEEYEVEDYCREVFNIMESQENYLCFKY